MQPKHTTPVKNPQSHIGTPEGHNNDYGRQISDSFSFNPTTHNSTAPGVVVINNYNTIRDFSNNPQNIQK